MKLTLRVELDVDKESYATPVDGDIKSSVLDSLTEIVSQIEQEDGVEVVSVRAA